MRMNSIIKRLTILAILACSLVVFVGCGSKEATTKTEESTKQATTTGKLPIATIKVKDYGTMELELYPDIAPNTVNNFIYLAQKGTYNGLTFHRIIDKFMIQGGDPAGDGTGGPGYSIKGEFKANNFENKLLHEVGVISMARAADVNSAGSQFFIMTSVATNLDGNYAAFGKVIKGLDVLTTIGKVKTGANDKPSKDVIIESITIDTKGVEYKEPEKVK
jgi:peptidyl-prolyl cis-trans isomerase B (cyclophilin B)